MNSGGEDMYVYMYVSVHIDTLKRMRLRVDFVQTMLASAHVQIAHACIHTFIHVYAHAH
jgi:hypothetical protein